MLFTFKGDGASQDTTVFGVTFPTERAITAPSLTAAQVALLKGNPMFLVEEEPAPEPAPEPVLEPAPVIEPEHAPEPAPEPAPEHQPEG